MDALFTGVLSNAAAAALLALLAFGGGLRIRRPALRHGLWLLVFLKLLTPPILCSSLGWTTTPEPAPAPLTLPVAPAIVAELPVPAPEAAPQPISRPADAPTRTPIPWQQLVLSLWLGGSLAWIVLVLLRLRRFRKLLG